MKRHVTILLVMFVLCLVSLSGCETTTVTDPNTGETSDMLVLDSEKADKVEAVAEATVGAGGLASMFLPWLAPFVTAGVGGLAAWRKMRPKLEEATRKQDISVKAGATLAEALQMLKEKHPRIWDDIKPIIEKAAAPTSEIENAIRGFRDVAPKPQA